MPEIMKYLTSKNAIIGILILLLVILSLWGSCAREDPDEVSALIQAAEQAVRTEYQKEIVAKDDQIKQAETKLADYKNRLALSEAKYRDAARNIARIQQERKDVKPPESDSERRRRFSAAGFPMLPMLPGAK